MLLLQKERAVTLQQAQKMSPEELEGRIVTGEFVTIEKPEYTEEYAKVIVKAQKEAK
jgi:2-oxoglutarate ferredoxin oxidoreductase subunit beta